MNSLKQSNFENLTFNKKASFGGGKFIGNFSLTSSTFKSFTDFTNTYFNNGNVSFTNTRFEDVIYFIHTKFMSPVRFWTIQADTFVFETVIVNKISIKSSFFKNANIVDLYATPESLDSESSFKPLSKKNIQDRETARVIKQIFDKQSNIPDSNTMYAIEQEFYLNELSSDSKPSVAFKKANIFTVLLNKHISDFGNNWIKVLAWIFIFAFLVLLLHDYLPCWSDCFTM